MNPCLPLRTHSSCVTVSLQRFPFISYFSIQTLKHRLRGFCRVSYWRRYLNQRRVSNGSIPSRQLYLYISSLYWFPADSDFSAANGWPQEWQNHQPYTNKLKARLPSTITPSTDGKQYLEQVYEPTSKLLELSGYREAVVNDDPNVKVCISP